MGSKFRRNYQIKYYFNFNFIINYYKIETFLSISRSNKIPSFKFNPQAVTRHVV